MNAIGKIVTELLFQKLTPSQARQVLTLVKAYDPSAKRAEVAKYPSCGREQVRAALSLDGGACVLGPSNMSPHRRTKRDDDRMHGNQHESYALELTRPAEHHHLAIGH